MKKMCVQSRELGERLKARCHNQSQNVFNVLFLFRRHFSAKTAYWNWTGQSAFSAKRDLCRFAIKYFLRICASPSNKPTKVFIHHLSRVVTCCCNVRLLGNVALNACWNSMWQRAFSHHFYHLYCFILKKKLLLIIIRVDEKNVLIYFCCHFRNDGCLDEIGIKYSPLESDDVMHSVLSRLLLKTKTK